MTAAELRAARERVGLTARQLALLIGLKPGSVSYWENVGGRVPRWHERAVRDAIAAYEPPDPQLRFWSKVDRRGNDECWPWRAATLPRGYGVVYWDGRRQYAHRVVWQLTRGPVPDAAEVCHECDTPGCCNPAHLFVGAHADNMADMAAKGRAISPRCGGRGERNGHARLRDHDVIEIRRRAGTTSRQQLADEFGVSRANVAAIVTGRSWKHLPLAP